MASRKSIIVRFDSICTQDKYRLARLHGFMLGSSMIDLIDEFVSDQFDSKEMDLLDANPRNPKRGSVTSEIMESLTSDPQLFHFKSKGVLIAASEVRSLDRNRFELHFDDPQVNGILDGGHNTLAIALYCLESAGASDREIRTIKRWKDLPGLWNRYFEAMETIKSDFTFLVPTEIIFPQSHANGYDEFVGAILQIAQARNNNTQLTVESKANKAGYYDQLKNFLDPNLKDRVEWKPNDGGTIKSREVIALALIPLSKTEFGTDINPVSLYSSKGQCVKLYEDLLDHDGVSVKSAGDLGVEVVNPQVLSALQLVDRLPEIYDLIYELLPDAYNKGTGGKFGRITGVTWDAGKIVGRTKFYGRGVEYAYPDGFLMPLVYAVCELMRIEPDGEISWMVDPAEFVRNHLPEIMSNFGGVIQLSSYDPQKVGKNKASYSNACSSFQNVLLKKGIQ